MTYDELLELLDLEEASDFQYFENVSDLFESDEEIEPETLYALVKGIDMEIFADITADYFNDILESVPDDAMEVYTLLDSVKMSLIGMAKHIEEDTDIVRLADEILRFRSWYSIHSSVYVTDLSDLLDERCVTMRDALTYARAESFGGDKYEYYFDEALNFEIDDYIMTFADLAREEQPDYDPQLDELDDLDIPDLDYVDQIFRPEDKLN